MAQPATTYKTIASSGTSDFRDRGSKFLGFSFSVQDREDIKGKLKQLKEQHPKANHRCYAWRLGTDGNDFRANDNGEPSGSAGRPILGQIDSAGLTNVLVVVVRYFGGTLLGVPGLIHAYKTTAAESLAEVPVLEKERTVCFMLHFDYTLMNEVMMLIRRYEGVIVKQKMELFCEYTVAVPVRIKEDFWQQALDTRDLKAEKCY